MWPLENFQSSGLHGICVSAALDAQEICKFCPWWIEEHLKEKVPFEPALYGLYMAESEEEASWWKWKRRVEKLA